MNGDYIKNEDGTIVRITTVEVDTAQRRLEITAQIKYERDNVLKPARARVEALKAELAALDELEGDQKK